MALTASVVIPTYRREDRLAATLAPLFDDPVASEIVVVVDGSPDGSFELLQRLARTEPRLKPVWQENAGGQSARHAGVTTATGDVVIILDDDVIAEPGLVAGHLRRHEERPNRVVVGYMPTRLPERPYPGAAATVLYQQDYEKVCRMYEQDPRSILLSFWSGNISLRRSDALRVDFSDQPRLRRHEDQLFGLRCADAGLEPVFDRSIAASHEHVRTIAKFADENRAEGASRVMLARRYPQLAEQVLSVSAAQRLFSLVVRPRPVATAARAVSLAMAQRAGRSGWLRTEILGARLLRQVENEIGRREACDSISPSA